MTKKDPYFDERVAHAVRFAAKNGQAVVFGRDGSVRLDPPEPPLPPFRPDYTGWVYVVQVRGFDLVKIGYSKSPEQRLRELQAGSGMGDGLELLLSFPGDRRLESDLHRRFADDRLFGEWFGLSDNIAEWICDAERERAA